MFGIVIGTVSLLGLIALASGHRRRWRYHHAGAWGHRGPWSDGPDWDGPPWRGSHRRHHRHRGRGRDWEGAFEHTAGAVLRRRLRLRDDQEDVVAEAVRDLRDAGRELFASLKDGREDLGRAVDGDSVDDVRLKTLFDAQDEDLARARKELVAALKKAHAVLDPEQRRRLADLIASGPGRWM